MVTLETQTTYTLFINKFRELHQQRSCIGCVKLLRLRRRSRWRGELDLCNMQDKRCKHSTAYQEQYQTTYDKGDIKW